MAENGILDYQGMNQAIYRGATSNIVVDTQSMSIEIGAGNTSHTSNLHFECNHDANVASIKLNSNVTTEFPRSKKFIKYPRVAMTGQTTSNYTVTGSSWYGSGANYEPWKAFDNVGNHSSGQLAWYSFDYSAPEAYSGTDYAFNPNHGGTATPVLFTGAVQGEWLKIQLPHKVALDHYIIYGPNHANEFPRDWTVYGSVDGTNWVRVDDRASQKFGDGTAIGSSATGKKKEYQLDTLTNEYLYFGFVFTRGSVNRDNYIGIGEIELYGVPEYDPDAHGTDVVVKSVPNVPNTDWLEVYYDAKGLTPGAVGSSISGLGGTTISATKLGDPQVSNDAFVFDGSGDAIVSGATSLSGNPPFSYSVWFKTNSISSGTGSNSIVQIGYSDVQGKSLGFRIRGSGETNKPGNYRMYVWSGATDEAVDTDIKAEIGTWTHATVVYNGLNSKLYMDGKFAVENTNTATNLALDSGAKVALGNYIDSNGALWSGNGDRDYDGSIANVRLFNRALTADEIYQLYAYQKEYFGHGDLSMTLKAGRLGIGTSEPRAALDVRGDIHANGAPAFPIPVATFYKLSASTTNATHDENIQSGWVAFTGANITTPGVIEAYTLSGGTTTQGTSSGVVVKLCKKGMYKLEAGFAINTQSGINSHIGIGIYPVSDSYIPGNNSRVHYTMGGAGSLAGYFYIPGSTNNINQQFRMTEILRVSEGPGYAYVTMTPNSNLSTHFQFQNWGAYPHGVMYVTYLG